MGLCILFMFRLFYANAALLPNNFLVPNKKLLQVKSLKLDMEGAGSDNQVKDLEQKLAAKQSEVDEALYRMQR